MELKKISPVLGGCCIGTAAILITPNLIIAMFIGGLLVAGIIFLIYGYK